ncbi:MAG TPA: DUF3108 domain-containing protein [Lacibacter sp.]|nr:DUF3108 domain-containing protein [Lacibacter sp.]
MIRLVTVILLLLFTSASQAPSTTVADEFCGLQNKSWQAGESILFHVYYTLAGIYVYGGDATFSVRNEQLNNKPVYHIVGEGKTNSFFDGLFKVRDKYESYVDTASLQPYKFVRNVLEGDYKKFETVTFNHTANTATSQTGTYKVPNCVQDVLSAIYYARNIDFNKYQPNTQIPFTMFIDDKSYNLYVRYLGKEKIKTRYGRFNAIKFRPLLIEGTIFKGGEKMTVWVTDDANKIPVRIESPISVGSVKVDMMGYKNARYPVTALIKTK